MLNWKLIYEEKDKDIFIEFLSGTITQKLM